MGADEETHSQMLGGDRAQTGDLHQVPWSSEKPMEEGEERTEGARGVKDTRRTQLTEPSKSYSYLIDAS